MTIPSLLDTYRSHQLNPYDMVEMVLDKCDEYADHNIWIHRMLMSELEPYLQRLENYDPYTLPLYGIPYSGTPGQVPLQEFNRHTTGCAKPKLNHPTSSPPFLPFAREGDIFALQYQLTGSQKNRKP